MQMMLTLTVRSTKLDGGLNVQCFFCSLFLCIVYRVLCAVCRVHTVHCYISTFFLSFFRLLHCKYLNFWRHFFDGMQLNECLLSFRINYRRKKVEHITTELGGRWERPTNEFLNRWKIHMRSFLFALFFSRFFSFANKTKHIPFHLALPLDIFNWNLIYLQ